jgi:hypothetical protein
VLVCPRRRSSTAATRKQEDYGAHEAACQNTDENMEPPVEFRIVLAHVSVLSLLICKGLRLRDTTYHKVSGKSMPEKPTIFGPVIAL